MGAAAAAGPTFYKDVLPVLQRNCQGCHRPGEATPMALMTYQEVRPWAKAIKEAVAVRRMPPWFADPHVGKFTNDRSLSGADIATLTAWADTGAAAGDPAEAPPPVAFTEGWSIPTPDLVVEMPESFTVPARGTIEYTYFIVPTGLTEDRWVQFAEARPGNRKVVHHIIAFIRDPDSKWLREYPRGKGFVPNRGSRGEMSGEFMTGYAPGSPPEALRPGYGKRIRAGSDIVFQMHYTASGEESVDRSKVGIVFARQEPSYRVLTLAAQNNKFTIPPGAPNHPVDGAITLHAESELISLLPHMHLRGKAMDVRAVYPTGETEKLLSVPRYDFNWQLWYQLPPGKKLPAGTRIEATGYFDNSPNNKANPDPAATVRYGDQSWEEMMFAFFDLAIPVSMNPRDLLRARQPVASSGAGR